MQQKYKIQGLNAKCGIFMRKNIYKFNGTFTSTLQWIKWWHLGWTIK